MKFVLFLLIFLGTTQSADNSYLSDSDRAYKCIEEYQELFKKYNPFIRLVPNEKFTKDNAVKLLDSLSRTINNFSFSNDTAKVGLHEMIDQYLSSFYPTRYQDPFSYLINARLVEQIDHTAKQLYPDKNIIPKFGTFYSNEINGKRVLCDDDGYVLMIDMRYPPFCHQLGKVALQPFANAIQKAYGILPALAKDSINKVIRTDEEININLLYTLLEFTYFDFPINDKLSVKGELAEKLLQYWNNTNESFIIGHEYAHELLKHKLVYVNDSNAYYLQSWYNEIEADRISQNILNKLVLDKVKDPLQAGWNKYLMMGGNFYLTTIDIYEQFKAVFDNDTELPNLSEKDRKLIFQILRSPDKFNSNLENFKTLPASVRSRLHPPSKIRIEILNLLYADNLKNMKSGNKEFDDVENAALVFSQQMIYGLNKMLESSKQAFHNAYARKNLLDQTYKRE